DVCSSDLDGNRVTMTIPLDSAAAKDALAKYGPLFEQVRKRFGLRFIPQLLRDHRVVIQLHREGSNYVLTGNPADSVPGRFAADLNTCLTVALMEGLTGMYGASA